MCKTNFEMCLVGIGSKTEAQTIAASLSSSLLEADTFLTAVMESVLFLRGVADVEEDHSKDNHTIPMSAVCHF
jgi:hypothetical protein